jgi:triosephosphate isomerase
MRKPIVLANWKMSTTITEALTFVEEFLPLVEQVARQLEIIICPPYTALRSVALTLEGSQIAVGGQDHWPGPGEAHTGAISARLLVDAGAVWTMVGHWEVRRRLGESAQYLNLKMLSALAAGLRPILLLGEEQGQHFDPGQLGSILEACTEEHIANMAFIYEPEGAIGQAEPVSPEHAATGCRAIRHWLADRYGQPVAERARLIYGGSVTPEHGADLMADPDIDGLGVGRKGRDPSALAQIAHLVSKQPRG